MIVKNYDFLQKYFFAHVSPALKKTNPADDVRFCLLFDFSMLFLTPRRFYNL